MDVSILQTFTIEGNGRYKKFVKQVRDENKDEHKILEFFPSINFIFCSNTGVYPKGMNTLFVEVMKGEQISLL